MDKNLLIQVFVESNDEQGQIAAGYPIASDRILTAAHVLGQSTSEQIYVRWYHQPQELRGWLPVSKVWDCRPDFDVAILEVEFPAELKQQFGKLSESQPRSNTQWESEGFARAGAKDNNRDPVPMIGEVMASGDHSQLFQLGAKYSVSQASDWKGTSGSPVFVNDEIIGVIVSCPPNFDASRLSATPTFRLLKDERFQEAINYQDRPSDERFNERVQAAIKELQKSTTAMSLLGTKLDVPQESDKKNWASEIINKLLGQEPPEKILGVFIKSFADGRLVENDEADAALTVLENVCHDVFPLIYRREEVRRLRFMLNNPQPGIISVAAKTKTVVEIALAGADRRRAWFHCPTNSKDYPSGKLRIHEPAESGLDYDSNKFFEDFVIGFASRILGSELIKEKVGESQAARVERLIASMKLVLEDELDFEGRRFYYVFELADEDDRNVKRTDITKRLQECLPSIAFITCSSSDTGDSNEEQIVTRITRILCKTAGIKWEL